MDTFRSVLKKEEHMCLFFMTQFQVSLAHLLATCLSPPWSCIRSVSRAASDQNNKPISSFWKAKLQQNSCEGLSSWECSPTLSKSQLTRPAHPQPARRRKEAASLSRAPPAVRMTQISVRGAHSFTSRSAGCSGSALISAVCRNKSACSHSA